MSFEKMVVDQTGAVDLLEALFFNALSLKKVDNEKERGNFREEISKMYIEISSANPGVPANMITAVIIREGLNKLS